jgi:hypothetical protein
MDPIAYPACVKCQITITHRFNPTCSNHYYCSTCALREIRDGKPCKVCGKALYFLLKAIHQFRSPFIIYTLRDNVMLSWNLVVFCVLAIVVVDLICVMSSSVIVGVIWPLLLLYFLVSVIIHIIAWFVTHSFCILILIRYFVWVIGSHVAWWDGP